MCEPMKKKCRDRKYERNIYICIYLIKMWDKIREIFENV